MSRERVRLTHDQREWVRNRDGRKCTVCGSTKRLEVHHVVAYAVAVYELGWTPERANNPNNLILLCQHHHTLVHGKIWDKGKENRYAMRAIRRTLQYCKQLGEKGGCK